MKWTQWMFLFLAVISFTACQKDNLEKDTIKTETTKEDKGPYYCEWDGSKVSDTSVWNECIIEPITVDDACGCIVSGTVKYTKDGLTYFIIYYGKGDCDQEATLLYCEDGDCKSKLSKKCNFKQDCQPEGN